MAKDYVGRAKPKPKAKAKSTRTTRTVQPPAPGLPWRVVVITVVVLLGFAYFLYSINGTAPELAPVPSIVTTPTTKPVVKPSLPEPPQERPYVQELEQKQVVVEPAAKPDKPAKPYQMQCASFRSRDKAEESKAMIAFAGLESQIKRSEGKNGVWYRVVLGPFKTKRDAEATRHKLQRSKINGCQIWHWNWD